MVGAEAVGDVDPNGEVVGGHKMMETRNDNDNDDVIKQHVWGLTYIDELCQIGVNTDPSDPNEADCETFYYAAQNANFNVLGIVDASGDLVEHYDYTPYGQRTVFKSAGTDDPLAMSPIMTTQRITADSVVQPYGLCTVGHQGLLHDEEFGLIYNRGRYVHSWET